ncbi:dephospho-CoA kinase [archaeon]|nr:MAG: dephospho-CoA kinase [archaeon]RLG65993.1 MAG: dephospho-CoA kinase [archaeon]HDM23970.1 flagellar hook-basal body complex protein FliE [Candidatus Bathyarchaeota archaeon]
MRHHIKKILCLTGMPGCGKSIVKEVALSHGVTVITMGDVVREETAKRGLDPNAENTGKVMLELRKKLGLDAVAKKCIEKLMEMDEVSDIVMFDGVRSMHEVERFRTLSKNIVIIAIHSSPKTRFERLHKRGRVDDIRSWEEFVERDKRELSVGIGDVIALADIMLVNEGKSLEEFRREVDKLFREVLLDE